MLADSSVLVKTNKYTTINSNPIVVDNAFSGRHLFNILSL